MGNKKIKFAIVFLLSVLVGLIVYIKIFYKPLPSNVVIIGINQTRPIPKAVKYKPTKIVVNCTTDADCVWMSTNCCPEKAGAYWQCLNKQSYIDCKSKLVLCPQVISPKPKQPCKCIGGRCSAA